MYTQPFIIAAFILGLAGSLHCLAMCGPLLTAIPTKNWVGRILYHAGRVGMYVVLGVIAGMFGQSLAWATGQQYFSVLAGLVLLLITFSRYFSLPGNGWFAKWLYRLNSGLRIKARPIIVGNRNVAMPILGALNGILPCGLSFVAATAAGATGKVGTAAAFMLFFGLGTVPALFGLGIGLAFLGPVIRQKMRYLAPTVSIVLAILLVFRGLNLDLGILSPKLAVSETHEGKKTVTISCCHKPGKPKG